MPVKTYNMHDRVRDTRAFALYHHTPEGSVVAVSRDADPALARYRVRWDSGEREWVGPTNLEAE